MQVLTADGGRVVGSREVGIGGSVTIKKSAYAARMHTVAAKRSDGIYMLRKHSQTRLSKRRFKYERVEIATVEVMHLMSSRCRVVCN
jgi:hypothetical protein